MDAQSLVWIDAVPRGEPDLECIDAAEADRRVANGLFPTGVMLGRALYRVEATKDIPAPWVRRAQRVVVCGTPNSSWLEALGSNGPQVRFLPAPIGPRSFGYLLGWLSTPPQADGAARKEPRPEERVA